MSDTPFQILARAPNCWLLAADNMQNASKLVWDACRATWNQMDQVDASSGPVMIPHSQVPYSTLDPAVILLAGLCLENLVKALRIKQDPDLVRSSSFDPSLTTHDLPKLFDAAGLSLNAEEKDFIERATGFVVWAGKYPFPKQVPSSGKNHLLGEDYARFERLAARLRGMLGVSAPSTS